MIRTKSIIMLSGMVVAPLVCWCVCGWWSLVVALPVCDGVVVAWLTTCGGGVALTACGIGAVCAVVLIACCGVEVCGCGGVLVVVEQLLGSSVGSPAAWAAPSQVVVASWAERSACR